ncbi:hypothetical protein BS47DRAFT_1348791 [Hydnum rufescens UP504]|uniref:DRBM domain-containing protein n=1 Tax=Hydnum rufescens UP504 TaxID=1448309 RepID=A0A9P6APY5_9AGAM|nr:hypothetical protein BS47DRAFT_1348791 [Hydnum rufescens UP504]
MSTLASNNSNELNNIRNQREGTGVNYGVLWTCIAFLNGQEFGSATDTKKARAKDRAAKAALQRLGYPVDP